MRHVLALDQGTTSSRSIVFDEEGRLVAMAQQEIRQLYPQPGWVEHDPQEIWHSQLGTARLALQRAGLTARDLAAIGLSNQRETTVLWRRRDGQPVAPAIVWQDRRTEPLCAALRERGLEGLIAQRTGLRLDAYFSATKLRWLLDHVPGAREQAEAGELAFGTVDSWLLWQLTGGRVHATDVSNASRTLLFDLHTGQWDDELLALFGVPRAVLPQVHPSSHVFGEMAAGLLDADAPAGGPGGAETGPGIPIAGVAGDQQAALFGQACFSPGMAKNTYGTGCFMLLHTGNQVRTSRNGLVSTAAASAALPPAGGQYALEGSVFVGGAVVQWLRDGLRAIHASSEVEALAESVPDAGGVVFVPAFTGLGAPYWQPHARGTLTGLTRGSTVAHIARAALESIAFQSAALLQAMSRDLQAGVADAATPGASSGLGELRVDGGACVNNLLMQFQADLLGVPVVRPSVVETTALGAAYLAGLATGVWRDTAEIARLWRAERRFLPTGSREQAAARMAEWEEAVGRASRQSPQT